MAGFKLNLSKIPGIEFFGLYQITDCSFPSATRYGIIKPVFYDHMLCLVTKGLWNLSVTVLSPTSVHLTWVTPCHTHQYHMYYRGTCGTYVDEGRLETDHQEYTLDGLQEGLNYSFTVNQTGFSGGSVLSTGPVYARTSTAGKYSNQHCNECSV